MSDPFIRQRAGAPPPPVTGTELGERVMEWVKFAFRIAMLPAVIWLLNLERRISVIEATSPVNVTLIDRRVDRLERRVDRLEDRIIDAERRP